MSFSSLFKGEMKNFELVKDDADDVSFSEYCVANQIKPLNQTSKIYHKPKLTTMKSVQLLNVNNDSPSYFNECDVHSEFSQNNQRHLIKALKSGKYKIIATIDLHNNTQGRAMQLLESFLNNHGTPSGCCIKIIHGKGLGSANGVSVLKNMVRRYLEHNNLVLAYSSGNINQGGDGVTLVKLRK